MLLMPLIDACLRATMACRYAVSPLIRDADYAINAMSAYDAAADA